MAAVLQVQWKILPLSSHMFISALVVILSISSRLGEASRRYIPLRPGIYASYYIIEFIFIIQCNFSNWFLWQVSHAYFYTYLLFIYYYFCGKTSFHSIEWNKTNSQQKHNGQPKLENTRKKLREWVLTLVIKVYYKKGSKYECKGRH